MFSIFDRSHVDEMLQLCVSMENQIPRKANLQPLVRFFVADGSKTPEVLAASKQAVVKNQEGQRAVDLGIRRCA
jgi:hypothetical protein